MNFNFLKTLEQDVPAFINLLKEKLLPGLAELELAVTPETTAPELTATLENDARTLLEKKYGTFVGEIVFVLPSSKAQIDKAIEYVVAKALPVAKEVEKEADALMGEVGVGLPQSPVNGAPLAYDPSASPTAAQF